MQISPRDQAQMSKTTTEYWDQKPLQGEAWNRKHINPFMKHPVSEICQQIPRPSQDLDTNNLE